MCNIPKFEKKYCPTEDSDDTVPMVQTKKVNELKALRTEAKENMSKGAKSKRGGSKNDGGSFFL